MYKNIFLVHVSYSIFRVLFDQCNVSHYKSKAKKCNLQCVRSTTIELKTRFGNRKLFKKTDKKSLEVAIDLKRTPHTIKLHFQSKDQNKNHNSIDTEKSVPKK